MPSMGILIKCAEQLLCSHCDSYINNLLLKLNSKAIGFQYILHHIDLQQLFILHPIAIKKVVDFKNNVQEIAKR